jgi:hypothetical protein
MLTKLECKRIERVFKFKIPNRKKKKMVDVLHKTPPYEKGSSPMLHAWKRRAEA